MKHLNSRLLFISILLFTFTSCQEDGRGITPNRLDSFSPSSGRPGDEVTLSGFFADEQSPIVAFGDIAARLVSANDTAITVQVPENIQVGAYLVSAKLKGNKFIHGDEFEVLVPLSNPSPDPTNPTFSLEDFIPQAGAPGDTIRLAGRFDPSIDPLVLFGSIQAEVLTSTASEIQVLVPAFAQNGQITVIQGASELRFQSPFKIISRLFDFSPKEAAPQDSLVLAGQFAFDFSPQVQISGLDAQIVSSNTHQIIIRVPEDATSDFLNLNINGEELTSAEEVQIISRLTGFEPAEAAPGDQVTLRGRFAFADRTSPSPNIQFNGVITSAQIVSLSPAGMEVIVPDAALSGQASIRLSANNQSFQQNFKVISRLEGVSPRAGKIADQITLRGRFARSNASPPVPPVIRFGRSEAAEIVSQNRDQIVVIIPEDAQSGKVRVLINDQTLEIDFSITDDKGPGSGGGTPTNPGDPGNPEPDPEGPGEGGDNPTTPDGLKEKEKGLGKKERSKKGGKE